MRCALLLFLSATLALAARLPVAFEPNRGQDPGPAEFIARTSGAALTLGPGRAEWISRQARVSMVFDSARRGVHGQGEDALPGVVNYLEGNQPSRWLRNIPTYARVRYAQVYPGIDVVYYVNDGRLEYDLLVARGADPGRVRLRVDGAQSLRVDEAGDLVIATAGGELRQHRPIVYQDIDGERRPVDGSYQVRGREVRFALGRYDRSTALVIDPALIWASYVSVPSSVFTQANSVALDASGNSYTTGAVVTSSGYYGCFIAEMSATGTTPNYSVIGAAPGDVVCNAIAVDSQGNIYLAGDTDSAYLYADTYYLDDKAYQDLPGYSIDAFVLKFSSSGAEVFGHYFGGSGGDSFNGIALDAQDNVYLVGTTNSTDLLVSAGAAQTGLHGKLSNAFVVAFTSAGQPIYSTYLGGTGTDSGNAIAVDAGGDAFITGSTTSSNFPTMGAYQSTLKGAQNAFVAKIGAAAATSNGGALIYSTYLGGSGSDEAGGIAVDPSGAVFVTGGTSSSDFPVTPGAYQTNYGGGTTDAFVTRLDGSGKTLLYSTYMGGSGADFGVSVAIDSTGNAYVTGGTRSTNFPVSADAFQSSNQGSSNAFVAGLNPSGTGLLFASYLGGSGTGSVPSGATNSGDYGTGVAVNCAAGLVVAGVTTSINFPVAGGGAGQTYPGVSPDAFVARVGAGGGIPSISEGGVVNSGNFAAGGAVAPGSLVSLFGIGLAPFTASASGLPLPKTLAGLTASVNGVEAPLLYAGSLQVNIQLPFETGAGSALLTVSNGCGSSGQVAFNVAESAPYIFQNSAGEAIVLNQDYTANTATNPAKVGSFVYVYLTGIGPVSNPPADGAPASSTTLSPSTQPWSATIGVWATPSSPYQFLGLAPGFVGLDQANIEVPALSTGAYEVVITVGGVASNGPTMYVTQ